MHRINTTVTNLLQYRRKSTESSAWLVRRHLGIPTGAGEEDIWPGFPFDSKRLSAPPVCSHCKPDTEGRRGSRGVCTMYSKFEEVLKVTGTFGKYQLYLCVLLLYSTVMWEGNLAQSEHFNRQEPKIECRGRFNLSSDDPAFCLIKSQCENESMYDSDIMITHPAHFDSIIPEWDLTCLKTDVIRSIAISQQGAMFLGSLIAGFLGDKFGRKRYLYIGQYGFCITAVLSVASMNWVAYAASNSIMSFFYAVVEITGLTLAMESTDGKHRLLVNLCFQSACAYIVIAPIAYLTRKWRLYIVIINFVTAPLLLGYLLVHESPRWVIQRGMLSRGAAILTDIASPRWNNRQARVVGHELRSIYRQAPVTAGDPVKHDDWVRGLQKRLSVSSLTQHDKYYYPTPIPLFINRFLLTQTLLLTVAVMSESLVHHAFHGDFDRHIENPYLATLMFGVVHLWLPIVLIIVDRKFVPVGRRQLFLISLAVMTICYGGITVTYVQHRTNDSMLTVARLILTMIGDGCRQTGFILAIDQITVEYYPTVLRCTALGYLTGMRHLTSVLILVLQLIFSDSVSMPTNNLVIGGIATGWSVICLILSYRFLVETKDVNLRETLDDCADNLPGERRRRVKDLSVSTQQLSGDGRASTIAMNNVGCVVYTVGQDNLGFCASESELRNVD